MLKTEFEPLEKMKNQVLGDRIEKVFVSDRIAAESVVLAHNVRVVLVCQ